MIFVGIAMILFALMGIIFALMMLSPILEFWAMSFMVAAGFLFFIYILFILVKSWKYLKEEIANTNKSIKDVFKE